ncbi:hypothetical protein ACMFMF_000493 [Clarireedia jacksonii]
MIHHFSFSLSLLFLPTLALSTTLKIASLPSCLEPSPITVSWTPAASGVTFKVIDIESPNLISHQGTGQPDASKQVSSFVWTPWTPTAEEDQDKKEYFLALLVEDSDGLQDSFPSNNFIVMKDCGGGGTTSTSTAGNPAQTTRSGNGERAATSSTRPNGVTGSTPTPTGNYTLTKSTDARNGFEKGWDDFTGLFTGDGAGIRVPWFGIWAGECVK